MKTHPISLNPSSSPGHPIPALRTTQNLIGMSRSETKKLKRRQQAKDQESQEYKVEKEQREQKALEDMCKLLNDEPAIVCEKEFDIQNYSSLIENSRELSQVSARILEMLKVLDQQSNGEEKFLSCHRLEIVPSKLHHPQVRSNKWEIRMSLNPVAWFDYRMQEIASHPDKEDAFLDQCRQYVSKFRTLIKREVFEFDNMATVPFEPTPPLQGLICYEATVTKDSAKRICNQFLDSSFTVLTIPVAELSLNHRSDSCTNLDGESGFNTSSCFLLQPKKELVRDLVMYPMPLWHVPNRILVTLPLFWEAALRTCHGLNAELHRKTQNQHQWPIECIALNFGTWESANPDELYVDKRDLDCHGDAHILLSCEFIKQCGGGFYPLLQGRQNTPMRYYANNANVLEKERLNGAESKFLKKQLRNIILHLNTLANNSSKMNKSI